LGYKTQVTLRAVESLIGIDRRPMLATIGLSVLLIAP
jgi:hypothetical protein